MDLFSLAGVEIKTATWNIILQSNIWREISELMFRSQYNPPPSDNVYRYFTIRNLKFYRSLIKASVNLKTLQNVGIWNEIR